MFCFVRNRALVAAAVVAVVVGAAASVSAQDGYKNARRLGGSTSFFKPPLTTAASLKKFGANKRVIADVRNVLGQAGLPADVAEKVVSTLANPGEIVKGATCGESTPADGTVVDCEFKVGDTLEWMAFKPRVKGKPTPSLLRMLRWAGKKPFRAFLFRVSTADNVYTFIVPKPCGNLSLVSTVNIAKPPVQVSVDRACTPDGKLTATVRATGDLAKVGRVQVSINGAAAGELTAPSWSMTSDRPGTYSFTATDKSGNAYPVAQSSVTVDPCPVPTPTITVVKPSCRVNVTALKVKSGYELTIDATGSSTGTSDATPTVEIEVFDPSGAPVGQKITLDNTLTTKVTVPKKVVGTYRIKSTVTTSKPVTSGNNRYEGSDSCEATINPAEATKTVATAEGPRLFVDGLFGKERRQRPASEFDVDNAVLPAGVDEFGQCSPMAGVKVGVAKRFQNDWEVAGDIGLGLMFVDTDEKVRKNPLFIDIEANKYLQNGMFVGTGISFWDLTRSETFTPAWLVHFGIPLNKGAHVPVYFMGEGRLFFDNIDSIDNNYSVWGGVRIMFPTK